MDHCLAAELESAFKKCSDCALHPEYAALLAKLDSIPLTRELVDYLCAKATSKKHIWEIRFDHLRILLHNPSSQEFDLKDFYLENLKKSRRVAIKLFFIRGYAAYASEAELIPVMDKFCKNLENSCGYIDLNYILSIAGLPYLVRTYGYPCFVQTLEKANEEHSKLSSSLRGYFTLNENLEQVNTLSPEECRRRMQDFLEEHETPPQSS